MAHRVLIFPNDANRRLDRFLGAYLRDAPMPVLYKLLRKKRIKLNGMRAEGNEMLETGDKVDFYLSPEVLDSWRQSRAVPPAAELTGIVYEDGQLLVVNKPAGLPSHGGMAPAGDTDGGDHLLARVLYYLYEKGDYDPSETFAPALCNRLDVNTGGLVVCGKTPHMLRTCAALFAGDGFDKEYLAVVEGQLRGEDTLVGEYFKDEATNTAHITDASAGEGGSKEAVTYYKSLSVCDKYSLLLVRPITGRSHQIRAHLAGVGHPLAGDKKYGGQPTAYMPAQLLHAYRLTVKDADADAAFKEAGAPTAWTAELPEGLHRCLRECFGIDAKSPSPKSPA